MMQIVVQLFKSRNGNFGMMTAILLAPLLGCVGMAIDYTTASTVRAQLQDAADAASVGAVAENSPAMQRAILMAADGPIVAGGDDAKALFRSNLSTETKDYVDSVDATVTKAGTEVNSRLVFKATVPTTFLRILGIRNVHLTGESTALIRTAAFMDFYLLLDNTPSMGIGATPADVDMMVSHTPDNCAFACHETDSGRAGNDYYTLARNLGATLRIDVVRQATERLMESADEMRNYKNQFRMAIYTFGKAATDANLKEVTKLTKNLRKAKKKAGKIDLMTIPKQGYNNDQITDFDDALTKIDDQIGEPGSGVTSASPQKFVFFVSDGVGDSYKPYDCTKKTTSGRCQEPIDLKYCTRLKDRGVKIAILYTTYLPLPTNSWYNSWIKPFQHEIGPRMAACASPGYYFEVSPTEGITEAMDKLFKKIVLTPRITS